MKKLLILVAVVVVVVGITVFGVEGFKGLVGGSRELVKKSINKNTPTAFDVGRIESLMKTEAGKINDFEGELNDLASKISGERIKVGKLEAEKSEQLKALAIAKDLLEQKKETYTISKQEYTYGEVELNATWRLGYVENIDSRITMSNSLITSLGATHKNCQAECLQAKKNLGLKQGELKKLQAREMNAEIKARANRLSQSLVGLSDSLLSHTALQEAFKNYENKVIKKEFDLNGVSTPIETVSITYDTSPVDVKTTVDKIKSVLSK